MGLRQALASLDQNPAEVSGVRPPFEGAQDVPRTPEEIMIGNISETKRVLKGEVSRVAIVADGAMRDARAAKAIAELAQIQMEERLVLCNARIDEILAVLTEKEEMASPITGSVPMAEPSDAPQAPAKKKAAPAKKKKD